MRRGVLLRLARAALAMGCAVGCAQIFGIEEACEVGTSGCAEALPELSCDTYCQAITTRCTSPQQYTSYAHCMDVCAVFPTDGDADDGIDNLACRAEVATRPALESSDCIRAGPTGGGTSSGSNTCGGACASYCDLMEQICPEYFDGFETSVEGLDGDRVKCGQVCASLTGTSDTFDAGPAGEDDLGQPSAQCRIWHLSVAATYPPASQIRLDHCGHAVGYPEGVHCIAVPGDPPPLPGTSK